MTDHPPRPALLEPRFANIPDRLKGLPQWVAWRLTRKGDRFTKVPLNARSIINTGRAEFASSTNSETWSSYAEAKAAYHTHPRQCDGIGFVLTEDLEMVGVDLDHVYEAGEVRVMKPQFVRWVQTFSSYSEISPSGEGMRIICIGKLPSGGKKRDDGYEIYSSGRYLTITGHSIITPPRLIRPRQDVIDLFLAELFPPKPPAPPKTSGQGERPRLTSYRGFDIRDCLGQLEGYKQVSAAQGRARCPWHRGDSLDSLSINLVTGAFHCFKGCSPRDVRAAIGVVYGARPKPPQAREEVVL